MFNIFGSKNNFYSTLVATFTVRVCWTTSPSLRKGRLQKSHKPIVYTIFDFPRNATPVCQLLLKRSSHLVNLVCLQTRVEQSPSAHPLRAFSAILQQLQRYVLCRCYPQQRSILEYFESSVSKEVVSILMRRNPCCNIITLS